MPRERRQVLYRGRVQGVGFRFTTQRIAGRFDVAGYVRNLDDGRVEVVAEGEPAELASFLDAVAREMGGGIRDVDEEGLPTDHPPLSGFTIRY